VLDLLESNEVGVKYVLELKELLLKFISQTNTNKKENANKQTNKRKNQNQANTGVDLDDS